MNDNLEGYCDGLAGAGAQRDVDDTDGYEVWLTAYGGGFVVGSLDRHAMLRRRELEQA